METESSTENPEFKSRATPVPARRERAWLKSLVGAGIAVLLIVLIIIVLRHRVAGAAVAPPVAPTVGVVKVTREDLYNEVTIYGEFRPFEEVALHAKISGYVDQMKVDFGDKVKAGQLLATLEVPELNDQLQNAAALRQRAQADYTNVHQIYNRTLAVYQGPNGTNLISEQDLQTKEAGDTSALAALSAAKAEEQRYRTLTNYTRITAPFDGVITHRYADPGALIQAGTSSDTQSMPLVRVSDNYLLRMDFPVSVKYVKDIHVGDSVKTVVESLDNKAFTGKVSRFTGQVDESTRDMTVEIEVKNPELEIVPGMYAAVTLKVQDRPNALALPSSAVLGGEGGIVYVVNSQNEIEPRSVKFGLETPEKYEVLSGLKEGEQVMVGNRAFVRPGQKVEGKLASQSIGE